MNVRFGLVSVVEFNVAFVNALVVQRHFAYFKIPRLQLSMFFMFVRSRDSKAHIARKLMIAHRERIRYIVLVHFEPIYVMRADVFDLARQRRRLAHISRHINVARYYSRQLMLRFGLRHSLEAKTTIHQTHHQHRQYAPFQAVHSHTIRLIKFFQN